MKLGNPRMGLKEQNGKEGDPKGVTRTWAQEVCVHVRVKRKDQPDTGADVAAFSNNEELWGEMYIGMKVMIMGK
eukprot:scaffold81873_cov35-Cyclotella_meneghiniana.AAC.1